MSCEKNTTAVGNIAGVKAGISALQSRFCGVTGRMVSVVTGQINPSTAALTTAVGKVTAVKTEIDDLQKKFYQTTERAVNVATHEVSRSATDAMSAASEVTGPAIRAVTARVGRSATSALFVLESFDGPKSLDSLMPVAVLLEAGALLSALRPKRSPVLGEAALDLSDDGTTWINPHNGRLETLPDWFNDGVTNRREFRAETEPKDRRKPRQSPESRPFMARTPTADQIADKVRKRTLMILGVMKLAQMASLFIGTGIGRMSRRNKIGVVDGLEQRFFFLNTTKIPVTTWKSSLTPLFNLADSGVSPVLRSDGLMFEVSGKTWHRGTIVIKTAQGERTLTHLQSLSVPAAHYYFNRRLDDNEAVGIVSNQKGFDPKHMPDRQGLPSTGYAGQISEIESLLPLWASLKRGLIQAHLRWGALPNHNQAERAVTASVTATPTDTGTAKGNIRPSTGRDNGKRRKDKTKPISGSAAEKTPKPPGEEAPKPKISSDIHPLDNIGPRVRIGDKEYRVMVRRIVKSADERSLADATYYDEENDAWKIVADDNIRERLASQVEAGMMPIWDEIEASIGN